MKEMTQTIRWRRLDLSGHEFATLDELNHGWRLSGTALFSAEQGPTRLDYSVICDSGWRTNWAEINGVIGSRRVSLTVSVDEGRRWHLNGVECRAVEGRLDIDLGFIPGAEGGGAGSLAAISVPRF